MLHSKHQSPSALPWAVQKCDWGNEGRLESQVSHARAAAQWKLDLEIAMFPLESLTPTPRAPDHAWIIRCHGSLAEPSDRCQALAKRFLGAMGAMGIDIDIPGGSLPSSEGEIHQTDSWSCGYWIRYYAEEECRRFAQEGSWSQRLSLTSGPMYDRLNQIRQKFRQGLSAKEQSCACGVDFE